MDVTVTTAEIYVLKMPLEVLRWKTLWMHHDAGSTLLDWRPWYIAEVQDGCVCDPTQTAEIDGMGS